MPEQDGSFEIQTPLGSRTVGRRAGEVLHPGREPLELLTQLRIRLGECNFAGQYQQSPAPAGGGIKPIGFKRYANTSRPQTFDLVFQSWDTTNKATELSDSSICTTWGRKGKDLFLLHVLRKGLEYPELKRILRTQAEEFGAKNVLIEDKSFRNSANSGSESRWCSPCDTL